MSRPKSEETRQRREKPQPPDLRLLDGGAFVPDAPDGLAEWQVGLWREFWESDVARALLTPMDVPAVIRLFWLYQEEELLKGLVDGQPMVVGSTGQPVLNPAYKQLNITVGLIKDLEDRFGLNPRGRLALGVALNTVKRGLRDLSAELDV